MTMREIQGFAREPYGTEVEVSLEPAEAGRKTRAPLSGRNRKAPADCRGLFVD